MSKIDQTVFVAPGVYRDLMRHAESASPSECCGILMGRVVRENVEFIDLLNGTNVASADPCRRFQLDWVTLLRGIQYLHASPCHMIAFYHSHTDGTVKPSSMDAQGCWMEFPQVIIPVCDGRALHPVIWLSVNDSRGFGSAKSA